MTIANRRLLLLSALAWPMVGTFVMVLDVATRPLLGAELSPAGVLWGWIGWCEWALLTPLLVLVAARFSWQRVSRPLFVAIHSVGPFVFAAVHSGMFFLSRTLVTGSPAEDPAMTLRQIWLLRLPVHLTLDFLIYGATLLATHVVLFFRAEWERERERLALERRIAQAELDIFKLHLQPEMVGEKLQALEALIERDPAAAETLLSRFSTLLRQSLAAGDARRPLTDEVAYANALVAVERLLDPATPELVVDIAAEAARALVPGACLTPIVHALLKVQRRTGEEGSLQCTAAVTGSSLRLSLSAPFEMSRDPEVRNLVREIGERLGDGERLVQETSEIVYEGPLVLTPTAEEDDTPLIHEEDRGVVMPHRLSLPLKVLIVIGAAPGVLLVVTAFSIMSAVARETPVAWKYVWTMFSMNWFAWPVTLVALWLGTRLPIAAQTWKRSVLVLALAAAAIPGLWDLGFQMLRFTIMGQASPWEATRALLRSNSSRAVDFLVFFGIALSALAYQRYLGWRRRAVEIGELDARLLRTRARLLRLQLNPHFLFNALNSIGALLEDDPSAARRMAARLRHFVDRVLKTSDRQEVPLGEELDLLTTYIAIENVRFSDRLELDLRIDETTLDAFVPSLLLQPLVENAVRHGLQPATGGCVSVHASRGINSLRLEVLDNGHTARTAVLREGIGLSNTRSRLRQLYGDHYTLEVERREDGFRATLTIPFRTAA